MKITLTREQELLIIQWMKDINGGATETVESEPNGCTLVISSIASPFGAEVEAVYCKNRLELGDATVQWEALN